MTPKQKTALRKLRADLLRTVPEGFNMASSCDCAAHYYGVQHAFYRPQGIWLEVEAIFGLTTAEADYLFMRNERHDFRTYDTPEGREGVEEFADRVENVLQYYRSVRA